MSDTLHPFWQELLDNKRKEQEQKQEHDANHAYSWTKTWNILMQLQQNGKRN